MTFLKILTEVTMLEVCYEFKEIEKKGISTILLLMIQVIIRSMMGTLT